MAQALAELQALKSQPPPATLADTIRQNLSLEAAAFAYREAVRQEELRVYELAGYDSVESSVIRLLPASIARPLDDTVAGLHSLYILAGIDQYYLVNVHFTHPYGSAEPLDKLRSYYADAQRLYGVDADRLLRAHSDRCSSSLARGPSTGKAATSTTPTTPFLPRRGFWSTTALRTT